MPWNEMDNWLRNEQVPLDSHRLLEIYEATRSGHAEELKQAAKKLYPERFTDQEPIIYVHQGSGRSFNHNGEYVHAKYTIIGSKLNAIGIMEDGTAYIY